PSKRPRTKLLAIAGAGGWNAAKQAALITNESPRAVIDPVVSNKHPRKRTSSTIGARTTATAKLAMLGCAQLMVVKPSQDSLDGALHRTTKSASAPIAQQPGPTATAVIVERMVGARQERRQIGTAENAIAARATWHKSVIASGDHVARRGVKYLHKHHRATTRISFTA